MFWLMKPKYYKCTNIFCLCPPILSLSWNPNYLFARLPTISCSSVRHSSIYKLKSFFSLCLVLDSFQCYEFTVCFFCSVLLLILRDVNFLRYLSFLEVSFESFKYLLFLYLSYSCFPMSLSIFIKCVKVANVILY